MKEFEEKLTVEDFEEEIGVKIDKQAFRAKKLYCDSCNRKMDEFLLDVEIPDTQLTIHAKVFRCGKCGREYLNGEQAKKIDRALAISKAITKQGFIYERAGNFDGSNIFVRFPAHMIKGGNVTAEIIPLSPTEFFIHFKKKLGD